MKKYMLGVLLLIFVSGVFAECDEQLVTQFFSIELQRQETSINEKLDTRLNNFDKTLTQQAQDFKDDLSRQFVKASIFFSIILLGVTIFVQGLIGFLRLKSERRYLEMIYKDNHDRHEEEKVLISQSRIKRGKHGKQ